MAKDDLISRAAAIDALGERPYNWTDSEAEIAEVCAWESHKSAIENINAVDAVPVVRCKDCKYWVEQSSDDKLGGFGICNNLGGGWDGNEFCSDGEWRESE